MIPEPEIALQIVLSPQVGSTYPFDFWCPKEDQVLAAVVTSWSPYGMTRLKYPHEFSTTINSDLQGGSVTPLWLPSPAFVLWIARDLPIIQPRAFPAMSIIQADALESSLDYLTRIFYDLFVRAYISGFPLLQI